MGSFWSKTSENLFLPPLGYHMKLRTWDLNISHNPNLNPSKKSQLILPLQPRVSCPHPLPAVSLMIYLMRHLGGLSHTETVWANRRGGTPHRLSHVSQYSSVTNSSSLFHGISSTAPQGLWPGVAQIHREIKPSVTWSRGVGGGGVIREINQYLGFISAHALERISLIQSIISIPVVLHNVTANKLSLWL